VQLVGASQSEDIVIANGEPVRRSIVAPAWAKQIVVEAQLTPGVWDQLTDFAITVYDPGGAQIENGAMNYPFHRVSADLPADRAAGYTPVIELFPAFANPVPPTATPVTLRVRFEGEPRVIVAPAALQLRAGAGTIVPLPGMVPFDMPAGWQPVLRILEGAEHDAQRVSQTIAMPATR